MVRMQVKSPFSHFSHLGVPASSFPLMCTLGDGQQVMAPVIEVLSLTWETWIEFLAASFGQAQYQVLQVSRE